MIVVDPQSATPPYEQVRSQFAAQIGDGSLVVGAKLPTVRALAGELGLATNTVARAYRELEEAGLVETRGRLGTVVSAAGGRTSARMLEAAQAYAKVAHANGVDPHVALRIVTAALEAD